MYLSEYLKILHKGHQNFEFLDVWLDCDNLLFIDPCLIEQSNNPWCVEAARTIKVFFDNLFYAMRCDSCRLYDLLSHASEQNATKLGYGTGENGKGNTADGLIECFAKLISLAQEIPSIGEVQDIPVFVEGFAEDGLSDMLTNILHALLNDFTAEQMDYLGIPPHTEKRIWFFDADKAEWVEELRPCWLYKNKELLMVPKNIVRKNYLFKVHQYMYSVIAERLRKEMDLEDLPKKVILDNIPNKTEHWEYDNAIEYTKLNPDALEEYHNRIPLFYRRTRAVLSDDMLDFYLYKEL